MSTSSTLKVDPTKPVVRPVKAAEVSPNEIVVVQAPVVAVEPPSIKTEPWTSFGSFDTRIFKDDFCHEKHLTVKGKATSIKGATFKTKEAITYDKGALKWKDEIKLWFPIQNRQEHLHFRLTNNDVRVHVDGGVTEIGGENVNIYSSLGFSRDFKLYNFKLGFATLFKDNNTDNRLKINNEKNLSWYHKTLLRHQGFRFGFVGVLDLTNLLLLKKDILLGYKEKDVEVILKAEQAFDRPTKDFKNFAEYFSDVSLTGLYSNGLSQRYGLRVEGDPMSRKWRATALMEYKYSDSSITKLSVDTESTLNVVVKKTLNKIWSLSGGVSVPLTNASDSKFGGQIDINV